MKICQRALATSVTVTFTTGQVATFSKVTDWVITDHRLQITMQLTDDEISTRAWPLSSTADVRIDCKAISEDASDAKSENDAFNEGLSAILKTRSSRMVYNPYSELQQPRLHAAFINGVSRGLEEL